MMAFVVTDCMQHFEDSYRERRQISANSVDFLYKNIFERVFAAMAYSS